MAMDEGALVRLRVSPNANITGLRGPYGDAALELAVAAPPAEVDRSLAGKAGSEASRVRVVRGLSGKDKTVFVDGVSAERVRKVLASRPR